MLSPSKHEIHFFQQRVRTLSVFGYPFG